MFDGPLPGLAALLYFSSDFSCFNSNAWSPGDPRNFFFFRVLLHYTKLYRVSSSITSETRGAKIFEDFCSYTINALIQ